MREGHRTARPQHRVGCDTSAPRGSEEAKPAPAAPVPMPRFFFDIHDGETFTPDRVGLELDDLAAAKEEAKKTLPEIVKDELPDGTGATLSSMSRTGPDRSSGG